VTPIPPGAIRYFHWESRDFGVEATLTIQGGQVSLEDIVGSAPHKVSEQFLQPVPANYRVFVEKELGRGYITVIQQPSAENNQTVKIRISDPYGEGSEYKLNLYFQPEGSNR
jgi:hypothetical protein